MKFEEEHRIFSEFLVRNGLKHSGQRLAVFSVFLSVERHLSAEQLYAEVKKRHTGIGIATVYRTIKLICEAGLGREIRFNDGTTRYEHLYGHTHHDHIICVKCRACVEAADPEIERLQERLFRKFGYKPMGHRMELYGLCQRCR